MPLSRKLMARRRIVMRPSARVLQGLIRLGRYNYTAAKPGLPRHRHCRAMEICFLIKGRQMYSVGGELFRLRGGDVFLTFPDEAHGTDGMPQEKGVLYWMILHIPEKGEGFLGLPDPERSALLRALQSLPHRHFQGSWKMKEHLDTFTRLHNEGGGPLRSCTMANLAVAFLLEVVACARNKTPRQPARSLEPVLEHIAAHLGDPLSIPELALRAGLSEPRFKVRFKEDTGVPPGEYVQRARIEEARRRLAAGDASITRIAFDLGFSSSQYFSTVFKRFTGRSPRDR